MNETTEIKENMPAQPAQSPAKPRKTHKKRSVKKIILIAVVVLLVLWFAAGKIMAAVRGPLPTAVTAETLEKGNIAQQLSTSGTVVSGNKLTVYAPVGAVVKTLSTRLGAKVNAGDELLTYDTTELERSYRVASAAAASGSLQKQDSLTASDKAQQTFNDAAANLQNIAIQRDSAAARVNDLASQYAALPDQTTDAAKTLKAQLDAATADLETQSGALTAAKASYDAAQTGVMSDNQKQQLEYGQVSTQVTLQNAKEDLAAGKAGVRAPISGVITSLTADVGGMTGAHAALCVIEGLDDVQVDISLSRYDLEKVAVGQSATVTTLGKTYTAKVVSIDSMATSAATTSGTAAYVHARIKLDAPDDALKLGIEANVVIATGNADNVLTVPLAAVNTDVSGQFCYVIENGTAVRRVVKTGLSSDSRVEITEGLADGDVVITSPDAVIAEGAAVAVSDTVASTQSAAGGIMIG